MLLELFNKLLALFMTPKEGPKAPPSSISAPGLQIIKDHEALRLTAYKPTPNDVWTIGWGHTKTAKQGMVITKEKAEELLKGDVRWVEEALKKHVKVPLNQNQFDSLSSLVFNIGETNFSGSTLLKRLNQSDYLGAADQFLVWNKQRNKKTGQLEVLNGLVKRRAQERELFLK